MHSADEADAVKRFWELLDEFVKEHPQATAATEPLDANGNAALHWTAELGNPKSDPNHE